MFTDRTDTASRNDGTLYGVVPRVSYRSPDFELTPFTSSLRACLTYLGQEISYARLHAGSGAAFRLMWNLNYWDGGNVDILNMQEDLTDPLRRAFRTAGRDYRLLCKPGKEGHFMAERAPADPARVATGGKAEFIDLIKREIDAGRPVIAFGIIGPPEACIITGYRDGGEALVGWNFFQDMPEWVGSMEKEPCGYFVRRGWFEHTDTLALMAIGDPLPVQDERTFLRETLSHALSVMETPQVGEHANGYAAYQAWAAAMQNNSEFAKDAPMGMLMERQMCQCDAMVMVGEGREAARLFLEQEAVLIPEVQTDLRAAAELFHKVHQLVRAMEPVMGGPAWSEQQARQLALPETRSELAKLIRQCEELDRRAAEHIRHAVSLLA